MMWTLSSAFILSVFAIWCFLFCGFEFKTRRFESGLGGFTFGLTFLVLAFLIIGLDSVEYGAGQIADDAGPTALKVNTLYAVKGAVEVIPEIGAKKFSPHIVLLCAVDNEGTSRDCDSPTNWLAYRLRYLPPPYFLKLKDGTYKEISLEGAKLLRETAR